MLLVLLCVLISAKYLLYSGYQYTHKSNLRQTTLLSKNNLLSIEIVKGDLYKNGKGMEWKDDGKELVVNNHYYEVITIKSFNHHYLILLKEDSIESAFLSIFSDEEDSPSDRGALSKILLSEYQLPHSYLISLYPSFMASQRLTYSSALANGFKMPAIKPPAFL